MFPYVTGLPGVRTAKTAAHRIIFRDAVFTGDFSRGHIIYGDGSRDPGNTGDLTVLRAGVLMGKITATGLWVPAIVGVSTVAYVDNDTTITVAAATATEIARLKALGGGGDIAMLFIGPPSANGTVAETAITVTAVGATTITAGDLGLNKVAGSFLALADGRANARSVIPDGFGVPVAEGDGTVLNVPFSPLPIAGVIKSANLLPAWPSDTSLRTWILDKMGATGMGKWIFDHTFAA